MRVHSTWVPVLKSLLHHLTLTIPSSTLVLSRSSPPTLASISINKAYYVSWSDAASR